MADTVKIIIEDNAPDVIQIPVGPRGPAGPAGADGAAGPAGAQGPQGPAGSGATTLNELTDVTITTPVSGQIIGYDGSQFKNQTLADLGSDIDGGFF